MHAGAALDELAAGEVVEPLAELVGRSDDEILEMQNRLDSGLDGARPRVAQHADRFDDPVAALWPCGCLTRKDAAGRGLGVTRVVLADVSPANTRRSCDLDDFDTLKLQPASQARSVAAGALDAGAPDRPVLLSPLGQRPGAATSRRKRLDRDESAEQVDERGGVRVAMGVDAEDDLALEAWHGGQRRLLRSRSTGSRSHRPGRRTGHSGWLARLLSGHDPPDRSVRSSTPFAPVDSSTPSARQTSDGEVISRGQTDENNI